MDEEKVFVSLEMPAEMKAEIERVVKAIDTNRSAWMRAAIKRQLKIDMRRVNKANHLPVSPAQG